MEFYFLRHRPCIFSVAEVEFFELRSESKIDALRILKSFQFMFVVCCRLTVAGLFLSQVSVLFIFMFLLRSYEVFDELNILCMCRF